MFSRTLNQELLNRNRSLHQARTQIDVLEIKHQAENQVPSFLWEQQLDDDHILPFLMVSFLADSSLVRN